MLGIAEKDNMIPAAASASLTPEPKEEEQMTLQILQEPCTSELRKLPIWKEDWTSYGEDFHQYWLGFACLHEN